MYRRYFVWVFSALLWLGLASCEKLTPETAGVSDQIALRSSSNPEDIGRLNAVKKCYQMTDFKFTPLKNFDYNEGTYYAGKQYKGMMYSSATETGTYVGKNVSLYTVYTAINNPRSLLYSERLNEPPYKGSNCCSYYGITCSSLVSYCLGLSPSKSTADIPTASGIYEVNTNNTDDILIADILWSSGHVMMLTDVIRDKNGDVMMVEVSEAAQEGCIRYYWTRKQFNSERGHRFTKVYRYEELKDNTDYHPEPGIVPVMGETGTPLTLNPHLCVNKGDRSNYLVGEEVVINLFQRAEKVEIYLNDEIYKIIDVSNGGENEDIHLADLQCGKYKADILMFNGSRSDSTEWIVVDYNMTLNRQTGEMFLYSQFAEPYLLRFCDWRGKRGPYPYSHLFTQDEIYNHRVVIPKELKPSDRNYFTLSFLSEFGIIQTRPMGW